MQKLAHSDSKMMDENQKLCAELQSKMQELARRDSERMVENQKLCAQLQSKMQELVYRTVAEVDNEENRKTNELIANLASEIEVKSRHAQELKVKCDETASSLVKIMEDKDLIIQSYNNGLLPYFVVYMLYYEFLSS